MLLFLSEKNQNLLDIQEHCIQELGKIWSELKLSFGVYYWFLSCIPGSFDTVTSLHMGFHSKRAAAGLGPSGLTQTSNAPGWTNIHRLKPTEKVNGFESGSTISHPRALLQGHAYLCNAPMSVTSTPAMLQCLLQHLPQQCSSVCYNIYPSNASVFATSTPAVLQCLLHLPQQYFSVCYIYPSNASAVATIPNLAMLQCLLQYLPLQCSCLLQYLPLQCSSVCYNTYLCNASVFVTIPTSAMLQCLLL